MESFIMKKLILLIGAPGSGKTTDATAVAQNHPEITSFSLGQLLKDEIEKGTVLGKINNDYISRGELVPTEITLDTIVDAMKAAPTDIVIIDGFPRKDKQVKALGDFIFHHPEIDLVSVIEIRVSEATAKARVAGTDHEENFDTQMKLYTDTIAEIEEHYQEKNLLQVVDGEQEMEKVITDLDRFLKSVVELA
jgi:adenylate kinase